MTGRKMLALLLVFTVALAGTDIYVGEISYAEEEVYEGSYDNQLDEDGYSRYFYDILVENYICQAEDAGVYGTDYVGLAKPQDEDGKIVAEPEDLGFTGAFESVSDMEAYGEEWFDEKSVEIGAEIRAAFDAFEKDYPQVFWLEGITISEELYMKYTAGEGVGTITVTITPQEYETGMMEYVDTFNESVIQVCQEVEENTAGSDTDELLEYIHDYIATALEYDFDATDDEGDNYKHTPVSVFVSDDNWDNKVVCESYAKGFKIICDRMGVECALLIGDSINSQGETEKHMWNAVNINDIWYAVDVTWDDQDEYISDKYFLAGNKSQGFYSTYEEDHIASNTFSQYTDSKAFILPQIGEYGYYQSGDVESGETVTEQETTGEETTTRGKETETSDTNAGEETTASGATNIVWQMSGLVKKKSYTGSEVTQNVTIKCNGETLKEGTDYRLSYSNNINVGTATLTIIPIGKYENASSSSLAYYYQIIKVSIKTAKAKKVKAQKYKKGKAIKPKVTLKLNGIKLKKGRDYTVSYKNNKKKGTATIIIKGKDNFKGKRKIKFKIK